MCWARFTPKNRARRSVLAFVVLTALLVSVGYVTVPSLHWHLRKKAHAEGATTSTGAWLNKGDNCIWIAGDSCTVTVQADPVSSSNPVSMVKVLAFWNQTWYVLCKVAIPDAGTTDHYSCKITNWQTVDNFSYPPNGPIRFRYDIVDSQGGIFYSTGDTFTINFGGDNVTPTPTVPANYAPCTGQWLDGGYTGEVFTKGNPQVITARVWPAAPTNPPVVQVEFLSQWPDGTRHDLAFVTKPNSGTTDQYTIYTDMQGLDHKYPPDGNIQVAFLCTDAQNKSSTFLDGGFHQVVFQSSAPSNNPQPQANGSANVCISTNYASCTNLKNGSYPSLGSLANAISSIQTGTGCHISMYLQQNFQGNVGYVDGSNPDLSQVSKSAALPNGFSKDIQSLKIENCTGDPQAIDPPATPTPNPGNGGSTIPGGMWVTPTSAGVVYSMGQTYDLVSQAYPTHTGDSAIASVTFTAFWNKAWHVLCTVTSASSDGKFHCHTNFNVDGGYPPNGLIALSFDVTDQAGSQTKAPNGIRLVFVQGGSFFSSLPVTGGEVHDNAWEQRVAKLVYALTPTDLESAVNLFGTVLEYATCGADLLDIHKSVSVSEAIIKATNGSFGSDCVANVGFTGLGGATVDLEGLLQYLSLLAL